ENEGSARSVDTTENYPKKQQKKQAKWTREEVSTIKNGKRYRNSEDPL
ncbi:12210_t:CDS:2, partial [Dentiscutata erythropus]